MSIVELKEVSKAYPVGDGSTEVLKKVKLELMRNADRASR